MTEKIYVLLLAGGSGSRMKTEKNKVLLSLAGQTCIARSAEAFREFADKMVLVCREQDQSIIMTEISKIRLPFPVSFVLGGKTRQESVEQGLQALPSGEHSIILIHDGARCLITRDVIQNVIDSVRMYGSGIASIPVTDTIKQTDENDMVLHTVPRASLRAVQTPQGFWLDHFLSAYKRAIADGFFGTDDASIMENAGFQIHLTSGSRNNIKLTTREDLQMAEAILNKSSYFPSLRVGHGYDVHQLCEGRKLILCGIEIPNSQGLLGHSDADVAVHALIDALLGAAGLGDIGRHFPDTDKQYEGISSIKLLSDVIVLLRNSGFQPSNADLTIIAQKPKLSPYIPQMTEKIAATMNLPVSRVNVKATTTEHLGFEGRMEGISAQAVCLIHEFSEEKKP